MKRTTISFHILAILAALGDLANGPKAEVELDELWGDGTGDNSAQSMFFDQRTLGNGANEDIDFATDLDGNGAALAFVEMRVLIIQCPRTNTAGIRISPSAADGWTAWFASSGATDDPRLTIAPGATQILVAPEDGSYAVGGANDSINVENLDGAASNVYTILALGTKA